MTPSSGGRLNNSLGGGTGAAALNILRKVPEVQITYLEKSRQMIALAEKHLADFEVNFINEPYEHHTGTTQFDVVVAHFFFDLFNATELKKMVAACRLNLQDGGVLIVADFEKTGSPLTRLWQEPIIWTMHRFFGCVSKLQSKNLKPIFQVIKEAGFCLRSEEKRFGGLIISGIFGI